MNALAVALALIVSVLGTCLVRLLALRHGMLDVPNQRSMHVQATPRGGGIAIVAAVVVATLLLGSDSEEALPPIWLIGGLAIALVGYADDRSGLSARTRMLVHGLAAAALVVTVPLQPLPMPDGPIVMGIAGILLAWLATVWSVNLFNFMDGIDGIASMQAVFVFAAATMLALGAGQPADSVALLMTFAAAALGFLAWNWPPARIFMGDAGSGFLGYLVAVGALVTSGNASVNIWTWVVLHGAFVSDATVTLLVRLAQGAKVAQPHRSHVYQRLARRFESHRATVALFAAINVFWLLPNAAATVAWPSHGAAITGIAVLPLLAAVYVLGGGRPNA